MASILGRLTFDADRDDLELSGSLDGSTVDSGLQGITVELLRPGNVVIATTTTDANGAYSFTGLPAGSYAIRVPTNIGGATLARNNAVGPSSSDGGFDGTDEYAFDSDVFPDGRSTFYNLTSNEVEPNIDVSYGFYSGGGPNGVVDGSNDGEFMSVGYRDADFDLITDGNDAIFGNGGNDDIRAGDGADFVSGGTGNDVIFGQAGNDDLRGDAGDDFISGGVGNDFIDGGTGNDNVNGDEGNDDLRGGGGTDGLFGGGGDDFLDGGTENDTLFGGDGNDDLRGGDGNDTVAGGAGDDSIFGGAGNDTIVVGSAAEGANDTVFGGAEGSADNDVLDLRGAGPVTITQETDTNDLGATRGTVTFSDSSTLDFEGIETILSDPDGKVDGAETGEFMPVGYSDSQGDLITDGNDAIFGNGGNDDIRAGDGADFVSGGTGNDVIFGQAGNDDLRGDAGDDFISGGVGNDFIDGGTGNDDVNGDEGNDDLRGGGGTDGLFGGGGDDFLDGGTENDTLFGGDGNDDLRGGDGNDTVAGGAGDDSIFGGAGDDFIEGGQDNDLLTGGGGNDYFTYTPGAGLDTITDFNTGNTGSLDDGDNTNNDFIDLSAYYDHISELYADQADDGILNQSNATDTRGLTVDYSDNTQFDTNGTPNDEGIQFTGASADSSFFTVENTGVICFTLGTLIATPNGEVPIETLKPGDLVLTRDNGPQPLVWIGQRHIGRTELSQNEKLRPIEISPRLIKSHSPLVVSRQHGILLRVGGEETLVRAIHLAKLPRTGARIMHGCRGVTYFHLMFETHQVIFAEGVPSESFYPGPQAVSSLVASARDELLHLFPTLPSEIARGFVPFKELREASLQAA